ncbi:uridine diphosphate-N-acetylglucosamine-binding protein YvcK [Heliobacterium undosum]|uniref:Putative gluconeogenesis factor n=1 Tax=Heliomicrobium undosum TaxID=121734 RepID=A0A845L2Z6_9FIRM|nr:gluconeogenesis factor YvcK family protein [Heliomicrobium undosum]MZP29385.1 uridine diphosphate-N-acetylglucosamine-binding protein YvcK [Heliomicrobium undosum]
MKWLMWFYPGLKVKRWMALSFLGLILTGTSISLFFDGEFFGYLENSLRQLSRAYDHGAMAGLGAFIFAIGLFLHIYGFMAMVRSIFEVLAPERDARLVEVLYRRRSLERGPKIVVIGGGTGLSVLLRGLKEFTSNLTAIVTVSDDGGSSGRLRDELGMVAPGDIRNCLVALADTESDMDRVLNYRFAQGDGLIGHNLGNLLLAGAAQTAGGFEKAVDLMSRILAVRGRVLPSTLHNVTLCAERLDGLHLRGETAITADGQGVRRVYLDPPDCAPLPQTLQAIQEADAIILGPGSLFTSVIPNLLVGGIVQALRKTAAPKIYVCNVMTQPGETDGFTASRHVAAIHRHCGGNLVDSIIVNTEPASKALLRKYEEKGQKPVVIDSKYLEKQGCKVVRARLINKENFVRHDPARLAQAIMAVVIGERERQNRVGLVDRLLYRRKMARSPQHHPWQNRVEG